MKLQETILRQVPRLLGLLDRSKNSNTYGCFDRVYWHYREKDVPNAEFQEAVLTLALLYKNKFPGNTYYKDKKILEFLLSAINFWTKIQNEDGSFNESYANEYSYVATAFSAYAVSEALIQMNKFPPRAIKALEKSGQWLIENKDLARLSNHEAGAVAALHNVFRITRKREYEENARSILSNILQSPEGWFNEYGGADVGYQSLSIDYLAKYYTSSKNKQALKTLESAVDFISYFIHPDGTSGGEYGSRSTEWMFPHGFKLVSGKMPLAGKIFEKWLNALKAGNATNPEIMDDRYFIEMLNNFLQTYLEPLPTSRQKKVKLPCETNFKKYFPEARFFIVSNDRYYSIFSGKGTVHVFSKTSRFILNDCGFIGKTGNKIFTSNIFDKKYEVQRQGNQVTINGKLHEYEQQFFSPLTFGLFKLFTSSIAKSKTISFYLKKKMIEKSITKSGTIPVKFRRKIAFDKSIKIEDSLESSGKIKFDSLLLGEKFSLPYVTFSKYFLTKDFETHSIDLTREFNSTGRVEIKRMIDTKKGKK